MIFFLTIYNYFAEKFCADENNDIHTGDGIIGNFILLSPIVQLLPGSIRGLS